MRTSHAIVIFPAYIQLLIIDTLDLMAQTGLELVVLKKFGYGMGEKL
jgi:hypothetical protein